MASVLDSNSFIAPTWKYTQGVISSDHRLKCMEQRLDAVCVVASPYRSIREPLPPPCRLPVPTKKLNQAPEVLPRHLFFGILDWPRFSGLSPLTSNTTSPGEGWRVSPRSCRGAQGACGSAWGEVPRVAQVAHCWASSAWPVECGFWTCDTDFGKKISRTSGNSSV